MAEFVDDNGLVGLEAPRERGDGLMFHTTTPSELSMTIFLFDERILTEPV